MHEIEGTLGRVHPNTLLGALTWAAVVALIGIAGTLLIRHVAKVALKQDKADKTAIMFLRPLAQIVLWLSLFVGYSHWIPELRALGTALLAGVSVLSIVLGVAAQNTLGNLIAGIALLAYRPFRVGDRLQVVAPTGVEMGIVESVTLGYTVLQTIDNRRVVLPNSLASNQTTVNLSSVDERIVAAVPVGIAYDADVDHARAILREIAESYRDAVEVMDCPVIQLGASSITLSLRAWCLDVNSARHFEWHVYEEAHRRFTAAGIEIPYPYQNIVLKRSR